MIKALLKGALLILLVFFIPELYAQSIAESTVHGVSTPEPKPKLNGNPSTSPVLSPSTMLRTGQAEGLRGAGMMFTQNKGQIVDMAQHLRPDVLYKGEGGGADIYLRKTGISYVLSDMNKVMHEIEEQVEDLIKTGMITHEQEQEKRRELEQKALLKVHRIDVDFAGGNANPETITTDKVEGYNNYYYAHCPGGITHVNSFNEVTQKNIYPGIDVKYYGGKERGLKYDIIVNPGGDPDQIKLKYSGANELKINDRKSACRNGNQAMGDRLIIETSVGELGEYIPKVYQNINGKIVDVKARYKLDMRPACRPARCEMLDMREKNNMTKTSHVSCLKSHVYEVNFELGTWNHEYPLIIDPWATYFGGNSPEYSSGIALDNSGNVVISGYTFSTLFPVSIGAFQKINNGGVFDFFVAKFNPIGTICLWATFYGGTDREQNINGGVATDNSGNVLITGLTRSTDFPIGSCCGNAIQQPLYKGGIEDAFVVKFDPFGARLWATFYGGSDSDKASGITTDFAGNILITGTTYSADFPVLAGLLMTLPGGGSAFVVKFNPIGSTLWATYYPEAVGIDISTDNINNVLITGYGATPPIAPCCANVVFQNTFNGGNRDAFVAKLNPSGAHLWATLLGGNNLDEGVNIASDNANNIIVSGYTQSTNFPTGACCGNIAAQAAMTGTVTHSFVAKFNSFGSRQWITYFGANFSSRGHYISTDSNNNIFLLAEQEDAVTSALVDACSYQPVFNGGTSINPNGNYVEDQLIVKYSQIGKKLCTTYMGGSGHDDLDYGGGIAAFGNSIYITGITDGNYPVTTGAFQTSIADPFKPVTPGTYIGGYDIFVASICTNICEGGILALNFTANNITTCNNTLVKYTPEVNNSCDTTGYTYQWTFTGGTPAASTALNPGVIYTSPGTYSVKLVVTTTCKKDSITKASYITVNNCGCSMFAAATVTANVSCSGGSNGSATATISAGGGGPYTYSWSNGTAGTTTSNTISVTGLSAGTYTVIVTEGACASTSTAAIISPLPLAVQFTKGTANCTGCGCKEWLMVTAAGGTSPYTYTWPDGYVSRYKNQLCPGAYSINIKDKNGCSVNVNLTAP